MYGCRYHRSDTIWLQLSSLLIQKALQQQDSASFLLLLESDKSLSHCVQQQSKLMTILMP